MVLETTTLPIELYPCDMGRAMGIEPMRAGATIQCVNHFTTPAIKGTSAKTNVFSNRQLPILPGRLQPSTFGVWVLNFCVRDGNRWATQPSPPDTACSNFHMLRCRRSPMKICSALCEGVEPSKLYRRRNTRTFKERKVLRTLRKGLQVHLRFTRTP